MKNLIVFVVGALIGAAIVYFVCCKPSLNQMVEAPKGIITPTQASALDKGFNSRHKLISDSIVKRPDNRSSWYSLNDMRSYLNYAESQAKDLGYTMDGIRVYLGAYPTTANQVGYTTMFFTPTGFKNTAEGSMSPFNSARPPVPNPDIPGGNGFNDGPAGYPPHANYPQ